jgi:MFS family permease
LSAVLDAKRTDLADPRPGALRAQERAFDWFNFFVANIQTGFGPFLAVHLTAQGWTLTAIGFALSVGTVSSLLSQLPAGALVDAARSKTRVAGLSVLAFTLSALLLAISPLPLPVYVAQVLHGFSSCTLGPAIAALSIAIAGQAWLGLRLGRNARYASIGNGVGAALMGACGYFVSEQAVFFLTALLTLPALAVLAPLKRVDAPFALPVEAAAAAPAPQRVSVLHVLADWRLLVFAVCAMVFTFANAPLLTIASSGLTARAGDLATPLIAACIVLPQLVVALASPTVGRYAGTWGRKPLLLIGFAMLPARGFLLGTVSDPSLVVLVQALDGIAAACFGVLVPLVTADIAGRSGHFNLSLGAVGLAIGIGGTLSPPLAGWIADQFGTGAAYATLSAAGLVAILIALVALPETRPAGTGSEQV